MSAFAITWSQVSAGLPDASFGLVLIVKWTAVLALSWLAHEILARRNPRWRVALWRSAVVGLVLVAVLSLAPPLMTYQSVPSEGRRVEVAQSVLTAPIIEAGEIQSIIVETEPTMPTRPVPAISQPAATVGSDDSAHSPAPARIDRFLWNARIVPWLWSIWFAGVLVLSFRLVVGRVRLARLIRRSSLVHDAIVAECQAIAERLGMPSASPGAAHD